MDEGYIQLAWYVSEISIVTVSLVYFGVISLEPQILQILYGAGAVSGGVGLYDKL